MYSAKAYLCIVLVMTMIYCSATPYDKYYRPIYTHIYL